MKKKRTQEEKEQRELLEKLIKGTQAKTSQDLRAMLTRLSKEMIEIMLERELTNQNYPNPFNPVTSISYALPKAGQVELNVYNLQGQFVQSLVNGKKGNGVHKAEFNGAELTSGMYIYNLKVDGKTVQSKKMMMLK